MDDTGPSSTLEYAETLTVRLAQAELEHDGRAIIQHDGVDVGRTSREILRSNVENPPRAIQRNAVSGLLVSTMSSTLVVTVPVMICVRKKLVTTPGVPMEAPLASQIGTSRMSGNEG